MNGAAIFENIRRYRVIASLYRQTAALPKSKVVSARSGQGVGAPCVARVGGLFFVGAAFLRTIRNWLRKLTVGRHPLPIFKLALPGRSAKTLALVSLLFFRSSHRLKNADYR